MAGEGPKTVAAMVLAVALGVVGMALGAYRIHKVRQIERGPTVEGRATGWSPTRRGDGYRVAYQFTRDGATYAAGWTRVPKDVHDRSRDGPLVVRHAADRPHWHLPDGATAEAESEAGLMFFAGAVVLVFALVALVLMWAARRQRAKRPPTVQFPEDPPPAVT